MNSKSCGPRRLLSTVGSTGLNHHESLSSQAIDSSGRRACIGYQPADARYAVPRTIIAHTVRAILLASATAMTIGRFCRAFMPSIHGTPSPPWIGSAQSGRR